MNYVNFNPHTLPIFLLLNNCVQLTDSDGWQMSSSSPRASGKLCLLLDMTPTQIIVHGNITT